MTTINQQTVTVGTRISRGGHRASSGVIFAIEGAQDAGSVRKLCGFASGGAAHFGIVLESGEQIDRIHESIVRSLPWQIREEVASPDEVAALLQRAASTRSAAEQAAAVEKATFAAEVERLQGTAEYSKLTQGDDTSSAALAIKNMRTQLKAAFPGVKFSATKPRYGAVSVTWTDGPTLAEVDALLAPYKATRYDSQSDCTVYHRSPWVTVFGGAEYINTSRQLSDELIERGIDQVFAGYAHNLRGMERPAVADYRRGGLISRDVPGTGCDMGQLIRQACGELRG